MDAPFKEGDLVMRNYWWLGREIMFVNRIWQTSTGWEMLVDTYSWSSMEKTIRWCKIVSTKGWYKI